MISRLQLTVLSYVLTLLIGVAAGAWLMHRMTATPTGITTTQRNVTTTQVPRAELRPQDVAPLGPVVSRSVAAQRQQGRTVQAVAEATGTVRVQDSGVFTNSIQPRFTEQKVGAVATLSTDKTGQPQAALNLYTIGPFNQWTPIADAQTRVIVAQPQRAKWNTTFALQGGIGLGPVGIVGLRWLQRGNSWQAESNTWALLSPAVRLDSKTVEPALLPVSVNLGRIPHQPFRDLWLSPVVSWTGTAVRYGGAITATF